MKPFIIVFKQILAIDCWGVSCEISLIWMSLDLMDPARCPHMGSLGYIFFHNSIMAWKCFSITDTCEDEWLITRRLPSQLMHSILCVFVITLNMLLKKESSYPWFEMPWCSCDINMMTYSGLLNHCRKILVTLIIYHHQGLAILI